MIKNDRVFGKPLALFLGLKADIETMSGLMTGSCAYAYDTQEFGTMNGSAWTWGQGGGGVTGSHTIMDEGNTLPYEPALNFMGASIWAVDNPGQDRIDIIVSGTSSGGGHTIQNEGSPLTQRANLNFVGASVNVTDDAGNDASVVTISNITGTGSGDVYGDAYATDEHLAVFDGDGYHIKDGGVVPAGASTDGWIAAGQTWTYEAADDPTYTFSEPIDATAKYSPGMKIKCTQGGSVKYGIITAVGSYSGGKTVITAYWGTDYNLGATITDPYYSTAKSPAGFPLDPNKWMVEVKDTSSRSQASPSQNTWYNLGSVTATIPIGAWIVSYQVCVTSVDATSASWLMQTTLSTGNNTESDKDLSVRVGGHSLYNFNVTVYREKYLTLTSATAYYLNSRIVNTDLDTLYNNNDLSTAIIRAVCAYL